MSRSTRTAGFVLWAAMLSLLLKAALPMLASVAAEMQGRPVTEVCPVFGIGLPGQAKAMPHDMHGDGHAHHHDGAHAVAESDASVDGGAPPAHGLAHGGHCALMALAVCGVPDAPRSGQAVVRFGEAPGGLVSAPEAGHDECADWVAQRKQGPPAAA